MAFCFYLICLVSICLVLLGHGPVGLRDIHHFHLRYDQISLLWDCQIYPSVTALRWPCATSCIDLRSDGLRVHFVLENLGTSKIRLPRCSGNPKVCGAFSSSAPIFWCSTCVNMGDSSKKPQNFWCGVMLGMELSLNDAQASTACAAGPLANMSCLQGCRMVVGAHPLLRHIPQNSVGLLHQQFTKSLPHPCTPPGLANLFGFILG